ncbi:MAG: formate dehydrogenase subunit gamma [Sphingomonadaceae bacterium]
MTAKYREIPEPPEQFVRFSLSQRIEHLLMMISFTALVATGLPQKFFGSGWAQSMILAFGGIENTRLIHRAFAVLFCLEALYHFAYIFWLMAKGRFVPSMIPGLKDAADAIQCFKYCIGLSAVHPKYDRFDFRQKFEYWGVVMGGIIVIATGLILMFPAQATLLLPGAFVPAAREMHGGEAILAFSVIVTWHLYGAHFNPLRFPGDLSIFTGKISRAQMIEEHPLEYARIMGIALEEEREAAKESPHGLLVGEQKAPTQ